MSGSDAMHNGDTRSRENLEDRVAELEAELDDVTMRLDALSAWKETINDTLTGGGYPDVVAGEHDTLLDRLEDLDGGQTRQNLLDQQRRGAKDRADIKQRLGELEDRGDGERGGERKWERVARYGAADVLDNPTATAERAAVLLENRERWGETPELADVELVLGTQHDLKGRLEDVLGTTLQHSQVHRALAKIDEWSGTEIGLVDNTLRFYGGEE